MPDAHPATLSAQPTMSTSRLLSTALLIAVASAGFLTLVALARGTLAGATLSF